MRMNAYEQALRNVLARVRARYEVTRGDPETTPSFEDRCRCSELGSVLYIVIEELTRVENEEFLEMEKMAKLHGEE